MTFVFVDMEGSTRIAQELPGTYPDIVGLFQSTLARIVEGCGGVVIDTEGDGRSASSPWSTGPRAPLEAAGPEAEAARFAGRRMSATEALALVRPNRYEAATSTAALTP